MCIYRGIYLSSPQLGAISKTACLIYFNPFKTGYHLASSTNEAWSISSGNENPRSHALQLAYQNFAETTLGIEGIQTSHLEKSNSHSAGLEIYTQNKRAMDQVVASMYENTQQALADAGIERLSLFRGAKIPNDLPSNAQLTTIGLQPASSFSTDMLEAISFAGGGSTSEGMAVSVNVPASHILGCARTGLGCLNEGEFVVFGGQLDSMAVNIRKMLASIEKQQVADDPEAAFELEAATGGPVE